MSSEQIYDKLVVIEKKLDFFEDMKSIIINNNFLCKCLFDLLYIASEEMEKQKRLQNAAALKETESELNVTATSSCPSGTSSSEIEEDSFEDTAETAENRSPVLAANSAEMKKNFNEIVHKLSHWDSEQTLLQVIQTLNSKWYPDQAFALRRNLNQEASTSTAGLCTCGLVADMVNEETAEEVFAVYPEYMHDAEVEEKKQSDDYEKESRIFRSSFNVSDTGFSDDSFENDNDTTVLAMELGDD